MGRVHGTPVMTTVLLQFRGRQVQCDKGRVSNGGDTGGICWNVVPEMDPRVVVQAAWVALGQQHWAGSPDSSLFIDQTNLPSRSPQSQKTYSKEQERQVNSGLARCDWHWAGVATGCGHWAWLMGPALQARNRLPNLGDPGKQKHTLSWGAQSRPGHEWGQGAGGSSYSLGSSQHGSCHC